MRRLKIFSRIYLFLAICTEAALVTINVFDSHEIWWSAIVGLALLYVYLLLHHTILGKSGYRSKALQWFFYLFYPAHLLILYLVFR